MTNKSKPTAGPFNEKLWEVLRDLEMGKYDAKFAYSLLKVESEARSVFHETGLTPGELKEQRDRLIEAAQYTLDVARHAGWLGSDCFPKLKAAIANGIIPD